MALYYFDIDDGFHQHFDDVGREFSNLQAVRVEAIDTLLEYVKSSKHDNKQCELVAEVADESGKAILRTSLSLNREWLDPLLAEQGEGIASATDEAAVVQRVLSVVQTLALPEQPDQTS